MNPDVFDDLEWAMRAAEAFLMMKIQSPNWNTEPEENNYEKTN